MIPLEILTEGAGGRFVRADGSLIPQDGTFLVYGAGLDSGGGVKIAAPCAVDPWVMAVTVRYFAKNPSASVDRLRGYAEERSRGKAEASLRVPPPPLSPPLPLPRWRTSPSWRWTPNDYVAAGLIVLACVACFLAGLAVP